MVVGIGFDMRKAIHLLLLIRQDYLYILRFGSLCNAGIDRRCSSVVLGRVAQDRGHAVHKRHEQPCDGVNDGDAGAIQPAVSGAVTLTRRAGCITTTSAAMTARVGGIRRLRRPRGSRAPRPARRRGQRRFRWCNTTCGIRGLAPL
jgi:hypothetical protein